MQACVIRGHLEILDWHLPISIDTGTSTTSALQKLSFCLTKLFGKSRRFMFTIPQYFLLCLVISANLLFFRKILVTVNDTVAKQSFYKNSLNSFKKSLSKLITICLFISLFSLIKYLKLIIFSIVEGLLAAIK